MQQVKLHEQNYLGMDNYNTEQIADSDVIEDEVRDKAELRNI